MMFRKQKMLLLLLTGGITGLNFWLFLKNMELRSAPLSSGELDSWTSDGESRDKSPELSIVAACMDRNEDLLKTVPSWLNALSRTNISAEIIIVDWSSKVPIQKTLLDNNVVDHRIFNYQVVGQSKWILSVAYNAGFQFSKSSKWVLKLDCDTFIERNFFLVHNINEESFLAGNYKTADTENEIHLNGVAMYPKKGFLEVGGYDERIQTYGFDDDNLYERLIDFGYKRFDFQKGTLKHLPHDDRKRIINQPDSLDNLDMENYLNHALIAMLPKWSNLNPGSSLSSEKINANHFLVSIDFIPSSLKELVKKGDIDYIQIQYCIRKLKEKGVSKSILNNHGDLNYYKKLLNTYSKGPMIMIEVQHGISIFSFLGLGNRLRSLASAATLAERAGRHLRIIWKPDHHCNANFYDLFDKSMSFDVYETINKKELSNNRIRIYNYMEPELGAVKYEEINHDTDKHIYIKSAYILSSKLVKESYIASFLRNLVPSRPVRKIIDSFPDMSNCIGVHVRNRSPKTEIDIRPNEYPSDGMKNLVKYRNSAKPDVFIRKMQQIQAKDPDACFFVSSDNEASKLAIQRSFGTDRVWILEGSCDDRAINCLQKALAELYILGRTKMLLGSFWSSFSEVGGLLVGKRPIYAGKDFY